MHSLLLSRATKTHGSAALTQSNEQQQLLERAVADRFLMAGAVSIVAAEGGCGKTSLLYAISEAISNGSPVFGQLPTIKGHVVIIEAQRAM